LIDEIHNEEYDFRQERFNSLIYQRPSKVKKKKYFNIPNRPKFSAKSARSGGCGPTTIRPQIEKVN
jgi:hypothetical protein